MVSPEFPNIAVSFLSFGKSHSPHFPKDVFPLQSKRIVFRVTTKRITIVFMLLQGKDMVIDPGTAAIVASTLLLTKEKLHKSTLLGVEQ